MRSRMHDGMGLEIKEAKTRVILNFLSNNRQYLYNRFSYSKKMPQSVIVNEFIKRLRKKERGKILQLGLFDSDAKIRGAAAVYLSDWDTEHFGLEVGKTDFLLFDDFVDLEDRLRFLSALSEKLSDLKFRLVLLRHPLNDHKTIIALSRAGWFLTDVLLTFHTDIEDLILPEFSIDLPIRIREAHEGDAGSIGSLARKSFSMSHFHSDPNLPNALSSELYVKWSISSLSDPSSKVFVAEDREGVCGFIVCSVKSLTKKISYGVIDLIAVDRDRQRLGIGRLLLKEALKRLASRVSSVYVGTQAINIPAVRLYESFGFKLVDSEGTFHLWV